MALVLLSGIIVISAFVPLFRVTYATAQDSQFDAADYSLFTGCVAATKYNEVGECVEFACDDTRLWRTPLVSNHLSLFNHWYIFIYVL